MKMWETGYGVAVWITDKICPFMGESYQLSMLPQPVFHIFTASSKMARFLVMPNVLKIPVWHHHDEGFPTSVMPNGRKYPDWHHFLMDNVPAVMPNVLKLMFWRHFSSDRLTVVMPNVLNLMFWHHVVMNWLTLLMPNQIKKPVWHQLLTLFVFGMMLGIRSI
ncbi:MAG: hypothetical protein J6P72_08505 [Firmicutes bacterium]|nr:hypothetical protein [Bacillota bacterium]